MRDELKENIRLANIVLAVATPIFFAAAVILRNAGEGALHALAFTYLFAVLASIIFFPERAKRRHKRDQ